MDVNDGIYVGPMTREQTVEQYKYRAGIHLSYITLIEEDPNGAWEVYGTIRYHLWAINGYERGIEYIEGKSNLSEVIKVIIGVIVNIFSRGLQK